MTPADLARGRRVVAEEVCAALGSPTVVKNPLGGSSLEVRVCDAPSDVALAFESVGPPGERILAEAFVKGREFTGGVDFEKWREMLPLPLSPMLTRGAKLNVEARLRAGYTPEFLAALEKW